LFNVQHADCVFSYGGKISEIILKLGVKKEKIIEIPAGIETSWINENIKPIEEKRKFVFVGRFERRKGVEELNKALLEIIHSAEMEMHFIGPIPKSKQIAADNVFYHGSVNDSERMKSLLRACDILICPSHSEGMPNVILEAMASGLAVIATDVGAVNLMVSKENGWLIGSTETELIRSAITNVLNIPANDLTRMKQSSVSIVKEKYFWDKIIVNTIEAIVKLI
jgi:glycosyltransferase involved in cell wall biosynthesis